MTAHSNNVFRSAGFTLLCTSTLVFGSLAIAQDGPVTTNTPGTPIVPVEPTQELSVQDKLNALALRAAEAVAPLANGETQQLPTLVMGTTGKCQWRAKDAKSWTAAKKDQKLSAGTQIRTGRKSKLVLRVGLNATLLIDSLARVTLPTVMQNGDTLTTTVQVDRGRTDVKVGHVGLTNDFSVLTPSGALAVKGTEFAVSHNALKGTQIVSARTNTIRAIEVNYFGSKVTQYLSASSVSTQKTPNPATRAAFAANGPPPLQASAAMDRQDAPSAVGQAISGSDSVQNQTRTQIAAQQESSYNDAEEEAEEEVEEEIELPPDYPLGLDGWNQYLTYTVPQEDLGHLAAGIYFDLKLQHLPSWADPSQAPTRRIPAAFENNLYVLNDGWHDPSREQYIIDGALDVPWGAELPDASTFLGEQYQKMIDYGDSVDDEGVQYVPSGTDTRELLTHINEFCIQTFDGNGESIESCRLAYANALNEYLYTAYGPTPYGHQLQQLEEYGVDGNGNYQGDDCPTCP